MSLLSINYEQLIAEELAGIISPEDKAVLDKAKAEHPEVYRYWEEMRVIFSESKVQDWLERDAAPPTVPVPVVRFRKQIWLAAAAVLTGLIIGGFFLLSPPSPSLKVSPAITTIQLRLQNGKIIDLSQDGKIQAGRMTLDNQQQSLTYSANTSSKEWAILSVPNGKTYKVTLSDGTEVFMNSASSIRFPVSFSNNTTKEVEITGEVYFKAVKDANSPLHVNAPGGKVQVLGTEFNVNSYDEQSTQVALVEGKVQFYAGKDTAFLLPGIAAIISKQRIYTAPFNADELLSWRKGEFIFTDKALEDILVVIPRLFGKTVVLDNTQTGKVHFTGVFNRNKSIQWNLDVLKKYNGIDYYVDADQAIHIK